MQLLIRQGSAGQSVKDVQALLNFVVPLPPMLTVDGLFGPKTLSRVVEFQARAALTRDGIVGPKTSDALVSNALSKLSPR